MLNHSFVTEIVLKIIGDLMKTTEQGSQLMYKWNMIVTALVLFEYIHNQQEHEQ